MKRAFVLPLLAAVIGFIAFRQTTGAENVRTVQILALVASGMGLGVALAHLKLMMSSK